MKGIKIRQLKPNDMAEMEELLKTRQELDESGAIRRRELLEWTAFKNPFSNNEPTYFIAEDNGKIVAHLARMPTEFIIKGKRKKGYFIHDLYVSPEYRKKGLGFFLSMSLYEAIEDNTELFCCLPWVTEMNLSFQRRRGYYELRAGKYVKVLNPIQKIDNNIKIRPLVKALTPIVRGILFLTDLILVRLSSSDIKVLKIDRFDSRFDNFSQEVLDTIGISSFKSSAYLNWKFVDRPFSRMEIFAAEKDGHIKGFIIIAPNHKKEYPEGTILDIMAEPYDKRTVSALLSTVVDYYRQKRVYSIECCLTDKRFLRAFRRFLFLKSFGDEPLTICKLDKCEDRDFMTDIDNWHLTYGESDEFALIS